MRSWVGQTRLLAHAEAIAALKGMDTEAGILTGLFKVSSKALPHCCTSTRVVHKTAPFRVVCLSQQDVMSKKRKTSEALVRYEASRAFFYQHLIGAMYCVFVIGPGTFRPAKIEVGDTIVLMNPLLNPIADP
eukprot:SAG22_NODE_359_length_11758_cov_4.094254_8_plen_132_part_00